MPSAKKGIVAAGHAETARAGLQMLEQGGNAFDAMLAAMLAAFVAEPCLISAGGGGFLLAHTASHEDLLLDFFVQTPRIKRPEEELNFFPIEVDFGITTQEFHIGLGSVAVPGSIAGSFRLHERLCTLPLSVLMEPAIRLAREGLEVDDFQSFDYAILRPILLHNESSRALFAPGGRLLQRGHWQTNPDFADMLEFLLREGERGFYEGEIAQTIARDSLEQGGYLTLEDLKHYQVIERKPLRRPYRDHILLTNPPPSSGGALIAFALALLETQDMSAVKPYSTEYAQILGEVMRATRDARRSRLDSHLYDADVLERFFEPAFFDQIREGFHSRSGSTSHISIVDEDGNAAAMTGSNGEGCGYVPTGTGMMLNNMLGEEDLSPLGFHRWKEDTRVSSMMSPTLLLDRDEQWRAVMGSGGSNRIRSAILQVIVKMLDLGIGVDPAVNGPRLHWEPNGFHLEPGFEEGAYALSEVAPIVRWEEQNMFYGGVHTIVRRPDGALDASGDRRRSGVVASNIDGIGEIKPLVG
ncbi:MAG: gamma-glutamyltransferase [Myxococcales bacterium]|nr:gamma-glutamyltransferase [Myxococcales bacterium]